MSLKPTGTISWYDADDTQATSRLSVVTSGDVAALAAAMAAISNAGITQVAYIEKTAMAVTPVNQVYKDAKLDKVIFQCYCESTGEWVTPGVPCPKTNIFVLSEDNKSDRVVDMTNPAVVALVAAIKAIVTSNSGAPVTDVKKGWRI